MNECPNCGAHITRVTSTGEQQILCNLNNEGGLQEGLDIMPLLIEASYMKTYPEERRGRAFVEFAGEGDVISMIDMLREDAEDGNGGDSIDLLRYQDPLSGMSSALHAAVNSNNVTVAWLLLWLASGLDTARFPQEIATHAQEMELARENVTGKLDVRTLKDSDGMTAQQRATITGGVWTEMDQARMVGCLFGLSSDSFSWTSCKTPPSHNHDSLHMLSATNHSPELQAPSPRASAPAWSRMCPSIYCLVVTAKRKGI